MAEAFFSEDFIAMVQEWQQRLRHAIEVLCQKLRELFQPFLRWVRSPAGHAFLCFMSQLRNGTQLVRRRSRSVKRARIAQRKMGE